jgi:hypothetical protein
MKSGEVKASMKSGSLVRLLAPILVWRGGRKVEYWVVERVDSGKKMTCPALSLVPKAG